MSLMDPSPSIRKKTQGRKKIPMKLIADENARRITLSKRKKGIFKKANELSSLCGVEIAIVIFSVGGKPFTFGYPNVNSVINRFLEGDKQEDHISSHLMKHKEDKLNELKQRLKELLEETEEKKKQRKDMEKSLNISFEESVIGLDLHGLEEFKEKMKNLKKRVAELKKQLEENKFVADVKNTEIKTLDGFPIPKDWLRL